MTIVIATLAVLFGLLAALRLVRVDGTRPTVVLLALTPYWVAAGAVLGLVALVLGQWWIGAGVLALATLLTGVLRRRAVPDGSPGIQGAALRVLAANLYVGRADVKSVVELVREYRVDVLCLPELTTDAAADFERAGLFTLLPHRLLRTEAGGTGAGLACRYPLTELALAEPSRFAQPGARIGLYGTGVEIVAVHPVPPTLSAREWKRELRGLPRPASRGSIRLLAGDFNATLDHAALRGLLRAGYTDAACARGHGFVPTWPGRLFPPPVTIDHILVDRRAAIRDYRVLDVPGSDHRAVYAELTVVSV